MAGRSRTWSWPTCKSVRMNADRDPRKRMHEREGEGARKITRDAETENREKGDETKQRTKAEIGHLGLHGEQQRVGKVGESLADAAGDDGLDDEVGVLELLRNVHHMRLREERVKRSW